MKVKNKNLPSIYYGRKFLLLLMMFVIYFKIRIASIDITKCIVILAIAYLICNLKKVIEIFNQIGKKQFVVFYLLSIIWTAGVLYREIIYSKNQTSTYITSREVLYISFFAWILPFFFLMIFDSFQEFAQCVINIMLIQSGIVIASMAVGPVKYILSLYYAGNKEILYYMSAHIKGISFGITGASGSVTLMMGQILLICLALRDKISTSQFWAQYMFIMVGEALAARTGFYFSIILLCIYFIIEKRYTKLQKNIVIIPTALIMLGSIVTLLIYIYAPDMIEKWIYRLFEIVIGLFVEKDGGHTLRTIRDMTQPGLSMETIFGTNVLRGVSAHGTVFNNDSGYWQKYFALGLVGAVAYYGGYFILLCKSVKKVKKCGKFLLYCIIILFLIEYKEPFISYAVYPMTIMSIAVFETNKYKE